MNNVSLIGRLVKDYEVKYLPNGNPVGNFTIAVDDGWGEKKHSSFFEVAVFGKSVENHSNYIKRGSKVGVEGSLRQERWESNDGQKRSKIKVVASRVEYLDSKPRDEVPNDDDLPF